MEIVFSVWGQILLSCKSKSITICLTHVRNNRRLSLRCHFTCGTRQSTIVIDMDLWGTQRVARNGYVNKEQIHFIAQLPHRFYWEVHRDGRYTYLEYWKLNNGLKRTRLFGNVRNISNNRECLSTLGCV